VAKKALIVVGSFRWESSYYVEAAAGVVALGGTAIGHYGWPAVVAPYCPAIIAFAGFTVVMKHIVDYGYDSHASNVMESEINFAVSRLFNIYGSRNVDVLVEPKKEKLLYPVLRKSAADLETVVFFGHGAELAAGVAINKTEMLGAADLKQFSFPSMTYCYFYSCYQGNHEEAWKSAFGGQVESAYIGDVKVMGFDQPNIGIIFGGFTWAKVPSSQCAEFHKFLNTIAESKKDTQMRNERIDPRVPR
jgi:hypothetical protein